MTQARMRLEFAGNTDPGYVRPNNEDEFTIEEQLGLLVVADGMGGHNSGEVASGLANSTIREFARKMLGGARPIVPEGDSRGLSARARQLEHFVKSANTIIYEKGRAFPKDAGMGTTVVAALIDQQSMVVAHVGDSRAYLFRNGRLDALTEDHSVVGDQVRQGLIAAADASRSTMQNILTRALGAEKDVKVDVSEHPLLPGDVLLLASDGLMKMVDDDQVARTIAQSTSARGLVESLIAQALAAGGVDNVTIVVARATKTAEGTLKGIMSRFFGGR